MTFRSTIITTALLVLPASRMAASGVPSDSLAGEGVGSVRILSSPESSWVVFDGRIAGRTPLTLDSVSPGMHSVVIHGPDLENWLSIPLSDSMYVSARETTAHHYTLPRRFLVMTEPFGAQVLRGDSMLGTTPLLLDARSMETHPLTVQLAGYEQTSLQSPPAGASVSIPLVRIWQRDGQPEPLFRDSDGKMPHSLGLYLAGAGTLISGVSAAYLKIKADDHYLQYQRTGSGSLLQETRRLDTAAAIAIVATQVGLALFAYFIFTAD